jgi:hypothetical protein
MPEQGADHTACCPILQQYMVDARPVRYICTLTDACNAQNGLLVFLFAGMHGVYIQVKYQCAHV